MRYVSYLHLPVNLQRTHTHIYHTHTQGCGGPASLPAYTSYSCMDVHLHELSLSGDAHRLQLVQG